MEILDQFDAINIRKEVMDAMDEENWIEDED